MKRDMNHLRLLWVFFRLSVLNDLQYRADFFMQLFYSAWELLYSLLGLWLIFSHTDNLGGWQLSELLALVGVFLIVRGAVNAVVLPSMRRLMEDVRLGTLDFTLTKPEDAQLLVSVRQVEIWKLGELLMGAGVLIFALVQLGANVGPVQALTFALALASGAAIVYSFLLVLSTCAFWFVRLENILVIFQSMYEAGRWPVGIYPQWLRFTLTFLVPVAFAITVPAEALIGRLTWEALGGAVALALAMLLVSRWFWKVGVRHYSGASA